jgi:hypothetical protein
MHPQALLRKILLAALGLVSSTGWSQDMILFKEVPVSRDEVRQQRLAGLHEFRCSYDFLLPAKQTIMLFAETFRDGKSVGLYPMSISGGQNSGAQAKGFISVGWRRDARELVTINDDGYLPWVARMKISEKEFETPELDWSFWAFYFEKSLPERRTDKYTTMSGRFFR